jgi:hypothetical protein
MQRLIIATCFVLLLSGILWAQAAPLSVTFSPAQIFVNILNTGSFDPVVPSNQPMLTNLRITNISANPVDFDLHLVLKWNNAGNDLVNVTFSALDPLAANDHIDLSNRDLITQNSSQYFEEPDSDINLDDVMNSNDILRSAMQSGYFPDGTLSFEVTVNPTNKRLRSATAVFTIQVKNISSIFPSYPGKPLGQNPPQVNLKPVTFLWNSINTTANTFHLVIKEFAPGNPPSPGTVETSGRTVYDEDVNQNLFDGFLPFQNGCYYAWQVSTKLFNESNFPGSGSAPSNTLKSMWNAFLYSEGIASSDPGNMQLTAIMNMLNDPAIMALFNQGYTPTGIVLADGHIYSGQEAIDLLNTLIGKNIQVEVKDQ